MMEEIEEKEYGEDFDPYKLVLEKPVRFGKQTIEELNLRDPTSREMRSLKVSGGMEFGDFLDIGQKLCETHRQVIDRLSKKDAVDLVERVCFLLADGT